MRRITGTLFLLVGIIFLLNGIMTNGSLDDAFSNPDTSGEWIATAIEVLVFGGLGLWCWQKPKKTTGQPRH